NSHNSRLQQVSRTPNSSKNMFAALILFLFSVIIYYIWLFYANVKRYPKGPTPYPIVGNLLSIDLRKLNKYFERVSKEYGDVFTVWLPKPHVVIMKYDSIKEAFAKRGDDFVGRSGLFPDTLFQIMHNGGIVFSQGDLWKEQRRVSLHILRDFGMGKSGMEEQVSLSAQEFVNHMNSIKNKDELDIRRPLQIFVANVINRTLYGYGYSYEKSDRLMKVADGLALLFDRMRSSKAIFVAQLMPSILDIPVLGDLVKGDNVRIMKEMVNTVREDVEKALQSWDDTQQPECFVHAYYQQMKTNPLLSYDNLFNVCSDLFLAGMETTATTLRWCALILAKHQDVQAKIRNEIFSVIDRNDKADMSLKQKLPYTNAAVLELQRFANIIAINAVHRTVKDTFIGSDPIPADTLVVGQIHNVMANSPVFTAPEKFLPERFLMDDGVTPNKEAIEQFCPFSIGKRMCVGEGMAKMELFIGLITIVQNFKIEPVKGQEIDLEPILATVMLPKPQLLRIVPI
uniref:Cytochrome n=1 Tax=Haemonchus contortus TaxID=6289 RepID=A0A7I4XXB2_HAECO